MRWNIPQACLWIASHDDDLAASLADQTFARLAFTAELESIDSEDEDHAVMIGDGMSYGQLLELLDQTTEYFGPPKADTPGTAWIGGAQKELLAACGRGALKMTGRSLYGGPSREIPPEAFDTLRFFERDGVNCLGPPDMVDADCWRDLRVQADDVRRLWSAMAEPAAAPAASSIAAAPPASVVEPAAIEPASVDAASTLLVSMAPADPVPAELIEWYRARVTAHDPKRPPPGRDDDERDARKAFPAMASLRKLVRKARAIVGPEAWHHGGPNGRKRAARSQSARRST
ncbi:hypothetical protein [Reyranella soli]|uniref:Uncharacterized protein n=1 Tax=Reyranella soli TaxID=1230389 RepID=A0A512NEG1_9HYPH|nr:hypothetical protein [Reyranella soli]GEP57326.1 hypothetical protein RSO01_44920 [Reyranella soli]